VRTSRTSSTSPPHPRPARCTSASRVRPTRTCARRAREPVRPRADPGRSAHRRGGVGRRRRAVETAADRVIAAARAWCGIPDLAERIVVRARSPRRLRGRPARVARQRARPRAHARSERRVPAAQRVAQGRGLVVRRRIRATRIGLPMCLISAELVLKRLRGDRTPGRCPNRPGSDVPGLYLLAILVSPAASRRSTRAGGWPPGGPAAHAAAVAIGTRSSCSGTRSASRRASS
jgi:hypothetical protein